MANNPTDKEPSTTTTAVASNAIKPESLESSPVFKERMKNALGGEPSSPAQFTQISRGAGNGAATGQTTTGGSGIAKPEPKSPPASIFETSTADKQAQSQLEQIRSRITGVINQLNNTIPALIDLLEQAQDNDAFVALAKSQGFSDAKAKDLLSSIQSALDKVTTK